jgi:hypothetical protein
MNFVECFFNVCFDLKVSPGVAFSKIIKCFKNYYVLLAFLKALKAYKTGSKIKAAISNLLVF